MLLCKAGENKQLSNKQNQQKKDKSNLVPTLARGCFLGGETCRQPIFIYKEVWKLSSQKLTL